MKKVTIEIPILPPKELNPNYHARGHWAQRYRAKSEFKQATTLSIPHQVKGSPPLMKRAQLSITFVIPSLRHARDPDNAIASLKPAIDACVEAGILQDDSHTHLSIKELLLWQVDKERAPLTILEFTEVENGSQNT